MFKGIKQVLLGLFRGTHEKEVLKKSQQNMFFRLGGRALSYVLVFTLIRLYGGAAFGKWTMISTVLLMTQLISGLGIKVAIVRFFSEHKEQTFHLQQLYQKALLLLLITSFFSSLILYLLSGTIAEAYSKPYIKDFLSIVIWAILPLNIIDLHSAVFRGLRKIVRHSLLDNFLKPLIFILFVLISYYIIKEFRFIFYAYLFSLYAIAGISVLMVYSSLNKEESKGTKDITYKEFLSISTPMFFTNSMNTLNRWADILILGVFCNDTMIGAYSLTVRLSNIIPIPLLSVNSISGSKFRELFAKQDFDGLKSVVLKSNWIIMFLGFIPAIIFLIAGGPILGFFDKSYSFAFWSLIILVVGQAVNIYTGSVGQLLNMTDGHKTLAKISSLSTLFNLLLNLLLIPSLGIIGAAIATSLTLIINNFACVFAVKKRLGFMPIKWFKS